MDILRSNPNFPIVSDSFITKIPPLPVGFRQEEEVKVYSAVIRITGMVYGTASRYFVPKHILSHARKGETL